MSAAAFFQALIHSQVVAFPIPRHITQWVSEDIIQTNFAQLGSSQLALCHVPQWSDSYLLVSVMLMVVRLALKLMI